MSELPSLKSFIMAWSDMAQATGVGAAVSAGSGIIGGLMSMIGSRKQYKRQKKLMALQNQYDILAFDREVQAQKDLSQYMSENANSWQKTSLRNAGYSTANPQGTGVQTAGVSAPSQDVPGTPAAPYVDYAAPWEALSQGASAMSNVRLINSQAKLNEIEAQYRAQLLEGQIGQYQANIEQIQQLLPVRIEEICQNIEVAKSQQHLNEQEAKVAEKNVLHLAELIKSVQIDNKYKDRITFQNLEKLKKEVSILAKEDNIKGVESSLAEYGILVGADQLTQIFSIAKQGHAPEMARILSNAVVDLCEGLPPAIEAVVRAVVSAVVNVIKGKPSPREEGKGGYASTEGGQGSSGGTR